MTTNNINLDKLRRITPSDMKQCNWDGIILHALIGKSLRRVKICGIRFLNHCIFIVAALVHKKHVIFIQSCPMELYFIHQLWLTDDLVSDDEDDQRDSPGKLSPIALIDAEHDDNILQYLQKSMTNHNSRLMNE